MFTGLKSVIYPSADLEKDKKFWTDITGAQPYFDQPYYVGFSVDGGELGLDPNATKEGLTYPVTYWHVTDTVEAVKKLVERGAVMNTEPRDVGQGMMMATLKDPSGNIFGVIDDEKPAQEPAAAEPQATAAILAENRMKIVIVEDNGSLAEIYKIRLESLGYTCHVAYDGEAGLALIEKELPALVLLDLMVPKVAGDQVLERMRASAWGKDIRVLIISNLNEADAPAGLRAKGIEGYAVKANLSNDDLDTLVDAILKPEGQEESVSLETPGV